MNNNSNIYIFDMGGVITRPSKIDMIYKEADMECEYTYFKNQFYHSEASDDVYKGVISDDEFFAYIKSVCKTHLSIIELENLYTLSKGGIYLETIKSIQKLKELGNSIYLLSNIKQIDYDYLNKNIDLRVFDRLFLSNKLGMCKPYEDIYNYVIDSLGTNDFHFFDDSKVNVNAAINLGINAHLTTGENIGESLRLIHKKK